MYFSLGISLFFVLLLLFLVISFFIHNRGVYVFYAYSGPFRGRLKVKYSLKDPPTCFYGKSNWKIKEIDYDRLRSSRSGLVLFELFDTGEIVLVDFNEKYSPKKDESVIIRSGFNYYVRKIEIAYDGYDDIEDYKYKTQEGELITYPEIVGNINYFVV